MSIFQEATDSTITKLTDIKIDRKREKWKKKTVVCQYLAIYLTNGISTQSELSQILLSRLV